MDREGKKKLSWLVWLLLTCTDSGLRFFCSIIYSSFWKILSGCDITNWQTNIPLFCRSGENMKKKINFKMGTFPGRLKVICSPLWLLLIENLFNFWNQLEWNVSRKDFSSYDGNNIIRSIFFVKWGNLDHPYFISSLHCIDYLWHKYFSVCFLSIDSRC